VRNNKYHGKIIMVRRDRKGWVEEGRKMKRRNIVQRMS
jgi:hypothetical protein